MLNKLLYFFLGTAIVLLAGNCAQIGGITGGPRDEDPPLMIRSTPENYSTNFTGTRIEITFDEFINLSGINQKLVVSPPVKDRPEVRLRGKTMIVDLKTELRENTTYTLNFGDAIEDVNERNKLENFEFVFSTGDYLDSLSVDGTILSAYNLKPSEEPFIIMAYDKLEDSIPMQEIPVYIGRSDNEGKYRINNMKADTFRIFALRDLNNNFIYDLPNENIAFADSFVYLFPENLKKREPLHTHPDSIINGETEISDERDHDHDHHHHEENHHHDHENHHPADTLEMPGQKTGRQEWFKPYQVDLFFFEEDRGIQYLLDTEREEPWHMFIAFNLPLEDTFKISGVNFDEKEWFIMERNVLNDTFNIWIRNSDLYNRDTLAIELSYAGVDSAGEFERKLDTLNMIHRRPREVRGKEPEEKKPEFSLSTIANKGRLDLNKPVRIETGFPVKEVLKENIFLYSIPDTVEVPAEFDFKEDSISSRRMFIHHPWKSMGKYRLFIEPGTIRDLYGNTNDTVNVNFSIQDEESYGTLFVNTENVQSPVIVQLLNIREEILQESFIETDTKVTFPFLRPGRFKVKFIHDINSNRKWDTGNYLQNIQPEKIEFYDGEINVRANWELEIKWELGDPR